MMKEAETRDMRRFYKYILVKIGLKHTRTGRRNISVKSSHWLSALARYDRFTTIG